MATSMNAATDPWDMDPNQPRSFSQSARIPTRIPASHATRSYESCSRAAATFLLGGTLTNSDFSPSSPSRGSSIRPAGVHLRMEYMREQSGHSQKYLDGTATIGKPVSDRTTLSSGGTANSSSRSVPPWREFASCRHWGCAHCIAIYLSADLRGNCLGWCRWGRSRAGNCAALRQQIGGVN